MARPHYTVVRDAEAKGIVLTYDADNDSTTATHGDGTTTAHPIPKQALAGLILIRTIAAEYPGLHMERDEDSEGWHVSATNPEHEFALTLDELDDNTLSHVLDAATAEGVDVEEGYEDAEERTASGSVVSPIYKVLYAERGDATHCGDWLGTTLKNRIPRLAGEGKKEGPVDVDEYDRIFLQNGVDSGTGKWGAVFHDKKAPTNGWEGRFVMSGRNILRKRVADAGFLLINDEKLEAPPEWCEEHRTAPKKPRKSRAKDPLDKLGVVPPADAEVDNEEAGA